MRSHKNNSKLQKIIKNFSFIYSISKIKKHISWKQFVLDKVYNQSYSVTTHKLSKPDVGKSSASKALCSSLSASESSISIFLAEDDFSIELFSGIFSLFSNLFCSINLTSFANALSSEDSSSIFCTVEPTVFESYCILSNGHYFLRLQKIRKGFLTEEVDQNLAKNRPRRKYYSAGDSDWARQPIREPLAHSAAPFAKIVNETQNNNLAINWVFRCKI